MSDYVSFKNKIYQYHENYQQSVKVLCAPEVTGCQIRLLLKYITEQDDPHKVFLLQGIVSMLIALDRGEFDIYRNTTFANTGVPVNADDYRAS